MQILSREPERMIPPHASWSSSRMRVVAVDDPVLLWRTREASGKYPPQGRELNDREETARGLSRSLANRGAPLRHRLHGSLA